MLFYCQYLLNFQALIQVRSLSYKIIHIYEKYDKKSPVPQKSTGDFLRQALTL